MPITHTEEDPQELDLMHDDEPTLVAETFAAFLEAARANAVEP